MDDDTLATFLRAKAAQLIELSRRLEATGDAPGIPLDDLVRLAQELCRKAEELEAGARPPRPPH